MLILQVFSKHISLVVCDMCFPTWEAYPCIWKSFKVYTAFLFMGLPFWKEIIEGYRVKLCGSNVLNCRLKITTTGLRKIGLKIRE